MSHQSQPVFRGISGYALALAALLLAFLSCFALERFWGEAAAYIPFFVAVVFVVRFASVGPALMAILAGYLVADWFFITPRYALGVKGRTTLWTPLSTSP